MILKRLIVNGTGHCFEPFGFLVSSDIFMVISQTPCLL